MSVKLTVERQTLSFDTDAIGIGRDADNQVALPNDSRLAPLHAILRFVNGRWIIESCEGGPLRIGNGRPARFAWLNPGDVIHLTETGPELVFEPGVLGTSAAVIQPVPLKPVQPVSTPVPAAVMVPHVPFIPHLSGEAVAPKIVSVTPKQTPTPVPAGTPRNVSVVVPQPFNKRILLIAGGVASTLMLAFVGLGISSGMKRTPQPQPAELLTVTPAPKTPDPVPVPIPITPKPALDPQEFLVLIGIGDLKTDDRPHVLGVGWLWDERTAVASRPIGEAIGQVVTESRSDGNPRQGCVIQGVAFEIGEIVQPDACPEISILRLREPVELPVPAREQWKKVNAAGIERSRGLGKSLTYFSYGWLPRPDSVRGTHGFPLCEYDPESCHLRKDEARLLYQQPQHFLKPDDSATRLERGGLLVDEDRKIVGMAPLNSPIIWTETLERVLGVR